MLDERDADERWRIGKCHERQVTARPDEVSVLANKLLSDRVEALWP